MSLALAEGIVSGEEAVIMDVTVNSEGGISPRTDAVMTELETAHKTIHRVFVKTTTKLSHIMELIEGEET